MLIFSINISNIMNFYIYFNIDLVSISLIILRIWILILIILRQFSNIFINSIYFIFFILNLRLVFSFLSNNIIIFYFFFWMIFNSNFFYYYGLRISIRTIKIQIYIINIYFICFFTFINNNFNYLYQFLFNKFQLYYNNKFFKFKQFIFINNIFILFS